MSTEQLPLPGIEDRAASSHGAASSSALEDIPLWLQFQRVGGGLTPTAVSGIIREADQGSPRRMYDLLNELRQKDGHLHSTLQTREIGVAGLPYEVGYPGLVGVATGAWRRPLRFVEKVLASSFTFRALLTHLMGGVAFGQAVAETLWERRGRWVVPGGWKLHPQRRFSYRTADGKLVQNDSTTNYRDEDFREQWPDKFIVSQPRINGDVSAREGLIRLLIWLTLFRNWTTVDWLKLAEIAWKPWRRGEYLKGASKEDVRTLEAALRGLTTSGIMTHSEFVKIHVEWPKGDAAKGSQHKELFDTMGAEVSKAVLGQTLTTEQGRVGSQALGNVHERIRRDIILSDSEYLAEIVTEQFIAPLVRLNFGENAPVPRFWFVTDVLADMGSMAAGLEKLVGMGLEVPQEWVRTKLGIPARTADEPILVAGGTAAPAPAGAPAKPAAPAPAEEDPNADPMAAPAKPIEPSQDAPPGDSSA